MTDMVFFEADVGRLGGTTGALTSLIAHALSSLKHERRMGLRKTKFTGKVEVVKKRFGSAGQSGVLGFGGAVGDAGCGCRMG